MSKTHGHLDIKKLSDDKKIICKPFKKNA